MNSIRATNPSIKGTYACYLWDAVDLHCIIIDFCRLYSTQNARWLRTRASPATGVGRKIQIPFFDAERFARLLEREGFSAAQARTVIHALDDVVDER